MSMTAARRHLGRSRLPLLLLLLSLAPILCLPPSPVRAASASASSLIFVYTYAPPGATETTPGPDWTVAQLIAFTGCLDLTNRGDCLGRTVATQGLFEQRSRRYTVGVQTAPTPEPSAPSPVFRDHQRQPCTVGGVFRFWPSGTWSYGGRWSRTIAYGLPDAEGVVRVSVTWSPAGPHAWSFFPDPQSCFPLDAPPPPTPSAPTPTLPPHVTPSPTPPPPPSPTPPPTCFAGPIAPMPLTLYVGSTDDLNNQGQAWTAYPPSDGRERVAWDALAQAYAQLPAPRTWHRVAANVIVDARFRLSATSFSRSDAPVRLTPYGFNPLTRDRNLLVALQDLGADRMVGGGDDRLLALAALGDEDAPVTPDGQAAQRMKVAPVRAGVFARIPLEGRPEGFQAVRDAAVSAAFTPAIFSWAGHASPPPQAWPLQSMPAQHDRDWLWPASSRDEGDLALRFVTEPNRVYRMLAVTSAPICGEIEGALAQLVFHTLGDADMGVTLNAPARAAVGSIIGYDLVVRNDGAAVADDVTLIHEPAPSVTLVHAEGDAVRDSAGRLQWRLGQVAPGETRRIAVQARIAPDAPDALVHRGSVRSANDGNPANDAAEATTQVVRANAAVAITAPRIVRAGERMTIVIRYRADAAAAAQGVHVMYLAPFGLAVEAASPPATVAGVDSFVWRVGDLAPGAEGTITITARGMATGRALLQHTAQVEATFDAVPDDNTAYAATVLLVTPPPVERDLALQLASAHDRRQQVYRSAAARVTWPIGEVLFFTPDLTLQPPPRPDPPVYVVRQRIVAWSLRGSGGWRINPHTDRCQERTLPSPAEVGDADLGVLRGCVYRYAPDATWAELAGQGRIAWTVRAEPLAYGAYRVDALQDESPANLRISLAVLTELVESGMIDVDGDGRTDSVLDRRTDAVHGVILVRLAAPRTGP